MAGNRRNSRNNRSFPALLNAPVWFYQACAYSFSFNQKRGKEEGKKNRACVFCGYLSELLGVCALLTDVYFQDVLNTV